VRHVPDVDPFRNSEPTYIQVAKALAARIESGEITLRLPAERALADEYKVSYETVRHSIKELRDQGVVITRQGRGTFVAAAVLGDQPDDQPDDTED
jgi:DNA-binding GntR family transcriptional regulator